MNRMNPITRSTWQYTRTSHIATGYDDYFADLPLFRFDTEVLDDVLTPPGRVIDLGCGTGRHVVPLVRRGFEVVGIDLSPFMLDVAREKLDREGLEAHLVTGSITDLSRFDDGAFRYALCMFSTMGLIRGADNREAFLHEVRRLLEVGGLFVFHVHNRFHKLYERGGRRWLLGTYLLHPFHKLEIGDIVGEYRGIPEMYLHTFSLGEVKRLLRAVRLELEGVLPLNRKRSGALRSHCLMSWRANGFIAVARKLSD